VKQLTINYETTPIGCTINYETTPKQQLTINYETTPLDLPSTMKQPDFGFTMLLI